jgi:hypothetical protein
MSVDDEYKAGNIRGRIHNKRKIEAARGEAIRLANPTQMTNQIASLREASLSLFL